MDTCHLVTNEQQLAVDGMDQLDCGMRFNFFDDICFLELLICTSAPPAYVPDANAKQLFWTDEPPAYTTSMPPPYSPSHPVTGKAVVVTQSCEYPVFARRVTQYLWKLLTYCVTSVGLHIEENDTPNWTNQRLHVAVNDEPLLLLSSRHHWHYHVIESEADAYTFSCKVF